MSGVTDGHPQRALDQRLRAVAPLLVPDVPEPNGVLGEDVHAVLDALVAGVQGEPQDSSVWLLLSAVSGQFPHTYDVQAARRELELLSTQDAKTALLRWASRSMSADDARSEIEVVTDGLVADVDFSCQHDFTSGIQRVVRRLMTRWCVRPGVRMVRFVDARAFVGLDAVQSTRMIGSEAGAAARPERRIIPWGVPVVITEVPAVQHSPRLAALAEFSPNRFSAVGYDVIPIISAELVADPEREKFGAYLELVKHCETVAGISRTAAAEFEGFVETLPAQGLVGPKVVACGLPTTEPVTETSRRRTDIDRRDVLCVGTLDRRKNQLALVQAAELLWRAGLDFRLRLVGAGEGGPPELKALVRRLREAGRPILVERGISDSALDDAYRCARVVVFPTLHEGFGLPVVEALSYEVPVITSNFGSTKEIAEGNGAILIDPENVAQLSEALRLLLTDDAAHERFAAQSRARPARTWDDYAAELWEVVTR